MRAADPPPLPPGAREALANVVVVLSEPQDVVNVAAVVRAMKNMGLSRLRLVRPADFDEYRIEGIAHRSADLVEATEVFDSLEEALADAEHVWGTTARARTAGRNYVRPREAAPALVERARTGTVALVFGREDRGLTNRELDLCQEVAIVPTDPRYWSLNLAQAALVVMYEIFLAAGGSAPELPEGRRATRPATRGDLEEMYAALHDGLARIEFFKGRKPESVLRTLRTILGQSDLDLREARLIRAIGFEIGHYLDRVVPGEAEGTDGRDGPEGDGGGVEGDGGGDGDGPEDDGEDGGADDEDGGEDDGEDGEDGQSEQDSLGRETAPDVS